MAVGKVFEKVENDMPPRRSKNYAVCFVGGSKSQGELEEKLEREKVEDLASPLRLASAARLGNII